MPKVEDTKSTYPDLRSGLCTVQCEQCVIIHLVKASKLLSKFRYHQVDPRRKKTPRKVSLFQLVGAFSILRRMDFGDRKLRRSGP